MTSPNSMSNRALEQYTIAQQLGESTPAAIGLIGRIIRELGGEQARQFLDQSLAIEANGGMLTEDGSRNRTLGGIFFFLVKQHLREHGQEDLADQLFPRRQRRQAPKNPPAQPSATATSTNGPLPPPLPPPGPQGRLRPRMRNRAEPNSAAPETPPQAIPDRESTTTATGTVLDSHRALDIARQTLTPAHGAYAIGAQVAEQALLIRFYFPDTAQQRYREEIAQIEQRTGWVVRVHPAPHQEQLAKAAQQALTLGDSQIGVPSIRFASKQVLLRSTTPVDEEVLATAQQRFLAETGWMLMVHVGNQAL